MFAKYFIPYIHGALTIVFWWLAIATPYQVKTNTGDFCPWYVPAVLFSVGALGILVLAVIKEIRKETWQ